MSTKKNTTSIHMNKQGTSSGSPGKRRMASTIPGMKVSRGPGRIVSITDASGKVFSSASGDTPPENLIASTIGLSAEHAAVYKQFYEAQTKKNAAQRAPGGQQYGNRTEDKIVFGPSRPRTQMNDRNFSTSATSPGNLNGSTKENSNRNSAASTGSSSASSPNFGGFDLNSLRQWTAASTGEQKASHDNQEIPFTEAEMKVVMGMFLEMTNPISGDSKMHGSSSSAFSFASSSVDPSSLTEATSNEAPLFPDGMGGAAAEFFSDPACWEALRRTYAAAEKVEANRGDSCDYDDEEDDLNSFENRELTVEEVQFLLHLRKQREEAAKFSSQFSSGGWESTDQVPLNDQEQISSKKKEKKQRRKAKLKEEAEQKAGEAEEKKREKAITSWRSRVVSACQSNEASKLDSLLQDSPLGKIHEGDKEALPSVLSHLRFLLPSVVAKNRSFVERSVNVRLRLAEYIFTAKFPLAFRPLRTGRSVFHTSCFYGDIELVRLVLKKGKTTKLAEGETLTSFVGKTCSESGWTPLHYAAASASADVMELLLEQGSDVTALTDVTHTWKKSNGKGLSAKELVQMVIRGDCDKAIETHGLALQEIANTFLSHHQERRIFLNRLERIDQRLADVEKNGYSPNSISYLDSAVECEGKTETIISDLADNTPPKNKKKKKKRKKKLEKEAELIIAPPKSPTDSDEKMGSVESNNGIDNVEEHDPLITALLGMGFTDDQIQPAVKACGGTHRATADDLVSWILAQGEEDCQADSAIATDMKTGNEGDKKDSQTEGDDSNAVEQDTARQKEETARRLAAKREEARRRNREWNNREQARQQLEAKVKVVKQAAQQVYAKPRIPSTTSKVDLHQTSQAVPAAVNNVSQSIQGTKAHRSHGTALFPKPNWAQSANTKLLPSTAASDDTDRKAISPSSEATLREVSATPQSSSLVPNYFTISNDDDKTVSSFGSNRGLSVSSKEFVPANFTSLPPSAYSTQNPPPGFSTQPTASVPLRHPVATVPENSSTLVFSHTAQRGEIRATAKSFIPSNLNQRGFTGTSTFQNDVVSQTPPNMLQMDQAPAELPLHQGFFVQNRGLAPSLDRVLALDPVSENSTPFGPSWISGHDLEESALAVPLSFDGEKRTIRKAAEGSSLIGSFSNSGSIDNPSIWGDATLGSQNIPSLGSSMQSSLFGEDSNTIGTEKSPTWALAGGTSSLPSGSGLGSIW